MKAISLITFLLMTTKAFSWRSDTYHYSLGQFFTKKTISCIGSDGTLDFYSYDNADLSIIKNPNLSHVNKDWLSKHYLIKRNDKEVVVAKKTLAGGIDYSSGFILIGEEPTKTYVKLNTWTERAEYRHYTWQGYVSNLLPFTANTKVKSSYNCDHLE